MFDLFRSRDKIVRILLGALLRRGGAFDADVPGSELQQWFVELRTMVVAEIGKDTITLPEVQRVIQATMRGRQLPTEILPTYIPQMIDQMVTERAHGDGSRAARLPGDRRRRGGQPSGR